MLLPGQQIEYEQSFIHIHKHHNACRFNAGHYDVTHKYGAKVRPINT